MIPYSTHDTLVQALVPIGQETERESKSRCRHAGDLPGAHRRPLDCRLTIDLLAGLVPPLLLRQSPRRERQRRHGGIRACADLWHDV